MSYIYSLAAIFIGIIHFLIGFVFFNFFKKNKINKEKVSGDDFRRHRIDSAEILD